jgi:hypothetical protein
MASKRGKATMKTLIEWTLIGVSTFVLLGNILSARQLRRSLDAIVVWLPMMLLVAHTVLRSVDRFAGWWGQHAAWKLPIAALILAVFPILAWLYQREGSNKGERIAGRVIAGLVWALAVGMVVTGWIKFPHPLGTLPSDLQGLDWVSLHHTPAIHHLYANATYLGFYVVVMVVLLWGRPFSAKLSKWMGSARIVNGISGILLLGSVISMIVFKR